MAKTAIVFSLILMGIIGKAQNTQFGIRVEPQLNWFSIAAQRCYSNESQAGLNIGLVLDRALNENYFFHTGIAISRTGGGFTCSDSLNFSSTAYRFSIDPEAPLSYQIQNLQIPVGLKFKTGGNQYYTFYGEIGIDILVRIHANILLKEAEDRKYNVSDELNTLNLGYHVGGGLEFTLNDRSFIQVGIAFTQGLMDIMNDKEIKIIQNMANLRLAVYF